MPYQINKWVASPFWSKSAPRAEIDFDYYALVAQTRTVKMITTLCSRRSLLSSEMWYADRAVPLCL